MNIFDNPTPVSTPIKKTQSKLPIALGAQSVGRLSSGLCSKYTNPEESDNHILKPHSTRRLGEGPRQAIISK